MTKEKLLKKRNRDIWLVVIFAILIVGFATATGLTNFYTDESAWSSFLAVLFIILFLTSFGLTILFGYRLDQDIEKLSLIQSGVPEQEVEEKYKEIQEAREKEQEDKQELNKRNRRLVRQARSEGRTYYYDGNGEVHLNPLPTKSHIKKSSFLEDSPDKHEIFDDPDLDDIVIMDFLDDDEDIFD